MPTGYTAELMEKGQTFQQFALGCARAFGALVEMRNDPLDKPIPEQLPESEYSQRRLAECKQELQQLMNTAPQQRKDHAEAKRAKEVKHLQAYVEQCQVEDARLKAMLVKVTEWVPPTGEHEELKKFMLEQLTISLHTREGEQPYGVKELAEWECKPWGDIWAAELAAVKRSIDYHTNEARGERDRNRSRNEWVQRLRVSLNGEASKSGRGQP